MPIAKKPAAKTAPKKTAPKTAAKAPVRKAVAKAPVKKPAAKAPAKKAPVAKKTAAPVKKAVATKTVAKKAPAKTVVKTKPVAKAKVAAKAPAKATKAADPITQKIAIAAHAVEKALDMNKAEQIVAIPLAGRSSLADWMVLASGRSARQVGALASYAQKALADHGYKRIKVEGLPQGDWVIVDSGDIVVHLFRPEVRDFYQLERLWEDDSAEPAAKRTLR